MSTASPEDINMKKTDLLNEAYLQGFAYLTNQDVSLPLPALHSENTPRLALSGLFRYPTSRISDIICLGASWASEY